MTDQPAVDPDPDFTDFTAFWRAYPRKQSKGDARKAWGQTAAIRPPLPDLLAAIERGKSSAQWHKSDHEGNVGAFIPMPATWLRGERWDDEYDCKLNGINGSHAAHRDAPMPKLGGAPTPEQIAASKTVLTAVRSGR